MTNDKFKLIKSDKVSPFGKPLFQIEALKNFGSISKGEKGGYVEKEENISVSGNAWVSGDASVSGDARVSGNASVSGDASVSGNASVSGKLKLEAGFFFGIRYQKEEIKYIPIDENYELIYKGDAKFGSEEDEKKTALLKKADELIAKANEMKAEAEKL